jgi:hypothetical protein
MLKNMGTACVSTVLDVPFLQVEVPMHYAPAAMTQEKRRSTTKKRAGGRPRKPPPEKPVATFLAEMDMEVRAFIDHLRTKARAESGSAPPAKALIRDALREWSEDHPEWSAFMAIHGKQ